MKKYIFSVGISQNLYRTREVDSINLIIFKESSPQIL